MNALARAENVILRDVPSHINDGEILNFLYTKEVNWQHVNAIKTLTDFNDEVISDWLNVSVKTFREYKKPQNVSKENIKEQVLLLLSLVKHGLNVLGTARALDQWLNQQIFYFDNRSPNSYLNTVTGIKFVDDRLTAMEYGDNVQRMEVFRISRQVHAQSLSAFGSANRWNTRGQYVIYAGSSRSLASLELVVHRGSIQPLDTYRVMVISIADDDYLVRQIGSNELPANWRKVASYPALQRIGSAWYTSLQTLVLKVPSAVIPYEHNYVINTEHPDFSRHVQLVRTEAYFWDSQLL